MANAKIEEIRQGFVDWLGRTPDTFKQQLSDRYNRLFNCFVRPNFDGTHQTFPDLDLKRLGIADLDRKSTRLNSSHANISYAVFCLKKKKHTSPTLLPQY